MPTVVTTTTTEFTPRSIISTTRAPTSRRQLVGLLLINWVLTIPAGAMARGQNGLYNLLYVAAGAGPIFGWIIDRVGRNCLFVALGGTLQLLALLVSIAAAAAGASQTQGTH